MRRRGYVRAAGIDIAFDDAGPPDAPVIVCTHAIGHDARDFELLRARFEEDHRVIALDWPDHGDSGRDRSPPSGRRYAEVLEAFLAEMKLSRPILLGNSIGGAAAFELVAKRPEVARALVVANLGGLFRRGALSWIVTGAFARFFAAGARGAWWFPRAFAAYYRGVLAREPARAQRDRIVANARQVAPLLAAAWRGFGEPASDLRSLAPQVAVPVLVTWAMADRFNPLGSSMRAIRTIPNARVVELDAGHNPFLECVEEAERALRAFEAELPS